MTGIMMISLNNISQARPIVTSGLVLYFNPADSACYSGLGTTVNDLSSNNLTGNISNITYTSPYFSYNGTNSQISISDNPLLEPGSGNWSMEAWFMRTNNQQGTILGKFDPGGGSEDVSYSIRMNTGGIVYSQIGSGSSNIFINSNFYSTALNTWYQIVYVWTNSGVTKTFQTYVNGTSIGTVNFGFANILNTSSNLYIGSYNNGEFSQWFAGRIGITRLYNTALSSAQVLQNYNANKELYGL